MAVDYDLVIVGSSYAGIYAAAIAADLKSRVALVTHSDRAYLDNELIISQALGEVGRWNWQQQQNYFATDTDNFPTISLIEAQYWAKEVNINLQAENSLATLAALGVDIIVGRGEFCRLPKLALNVGKRKLRSRNYLLATGAYYTYEPIDGAETIKCLTPNDIFQGQDLATLADNLILVGGSARSLELAQTLARFGKQIVFVTQEQRILASEDGEISLLIQAQLEAEGIKILTNSPVSQLREINGQKWLQAGDRALEADEIIFADRRQPNIEGLNLAGVEVKYDTRGVRVNHKLQTTNPCIYACGDIIGVHALNHITRHEINIAVGNALCLPWFKTDYTTLPRGILTQPNLVRIGISEAQIEPKQQNDVYIVREYFKSVTQAQLSGATRGLCKLLIHRRGTILGCSIVGDRAVELIGAIALMMQHKIKLSSYPWQELKTTSFLAISPSCAEILHQAAINFQRQKLQRNSRLSNWLETWFTLRRNWHK